MLYFRPNYCLKTMLCQCLILQQFVKHIIVHPSFLYLFSKACLSFTLTTSYHDLLLQCAYELSLSISFEWRNECNPKSVIFSTNRLSTTQFDDLRLP